MYRSRRNAPKPLIQFGDPGAANFWGEPRGCRQPYYRHIDCTTSSLMSLRWIWVLSLSVVAAGCHGNDTDDDLDSDEAPLREADESLGERLEPNEPALVRQIADSAVAQVAASQANDPNHVAHRD